MATADFWFGNKAHTIDQVFKIASRAYMGKRMAVRNKVLVTSDDPIANVTFGRSFFYTFERVRFDRIHFIDCRFEDSTMTRDMFANCKFDGCVFDKGAFFLDGAKDDDGYLSMHLCKFEAVQLARHEGAFIHRMLFDECVFDFETTFVRAVCDSATKFIKCRFETSDLPEFMTDNLSGCTGIPLASDILARLFEHDDHGYLVYKVFGSQYKAPSHWVIKEGSIVEEAVSPLRTDACACGVNVATAVGIADNITRLAPVWLCRIRWEWLPDVVVPYNASWKIRTARLELIREIEREAFSKIVIAERIKARNAR